MGKLTKRTDLLGGRASRVEKPCHTKRDRRTLPSWYHRVLPISFKEDRDVDGCDFDEDLSELEEDKEQEIDDVEPVEPFKEQDKDDEDCECSDSNSECGSKFEGDDDMDGDDESERSYDGSDADYYYELKEEREERKKERLRKRKEKEQHRNVEKTKEEEAHAAYRSLSKAEKERRTIPVGLLAGQSFRLFCSDHVDYCYSDLYATKRVEFYHLDDTNPRLHNQNPGNETSMLYGDVYLDANANCDFGPFCPPKRASRKAFMVRSSDGMYELSFQFIGNGYLKLRVSREMVFMNPDYPSPLAPPAAAPEMFEFVGIRRDREKEKAEEQEMMTNARRSPSPRENWFEMNHPMGSWHQSRYF